MLKQTLKLHEHLTNQKAAFEKVVKNTPGIENTQEYKSLVKQFHQNVAEVINNHNSALPEQHHLINTYTLSTKPTITDYCKCEKTPVLDSFEHENMSHMEYCQCETPEIAKNDTLVEDYCKCDEHKSLSTTADLVVEKVKELHISHDDIPEHLKEFITTS